MLYFNFQIVGKERKKKELIDKIETIFSQIQDLRGVSPGDFPDANFLKEKLRTSDWSKFKSMEEKDLLRIDSMLSDDMARLMQVGL